MPFKSDKQKRFMEAVAHNPSFAQKVGVKPSVGKEFDKADKLNKPPGQNYSNFSLPAMPQQPDTDTVINPDKKFKLLRSKLRG